MAEAMAKLPDVGATGVTSLEALKYASQADMFQDDPNFYSWLEDWIGKGDEDTMMIDAINTLTDYGMQFEFQQQHAKLEPGPGPQTGRPSSPPRGMDPEAKSCLFCPPPESLSRGISFCASHVSQPSSQPSDAPSLNGLGSSSSSSVARSDAALSSLAVSPPLRPCSAGNPSAAASIPAQALAANAAGPYDSSSFTLPLNRSLDTYSLPPELSQLLGRTEGDAPCTSVLADTGGISSHGTVTSYAGTPPPGKLMEATNNNPPVAASAGGGIGIRGASQPKKHVHVPSLEQLVVRAICGNNLPSTEFGSLMHGAGARGTGSATDSGCSGAGLSTLGLPLRNGNHHAMDVKLKDAEACLSSAGAAAITVTPLTLARRSSGSFNGDGGSCSRDGDVPCGKMCSSSSELPLVQQQQQQQSHRSEPAMGGGSSDRHNSQRRPLGTHHHHHHHHHHGITVSLARWSHLRRVGKMLTSGGPATGGSACMRASGGVNASGKPTRSARTKAVFAALEAEATGKLSELEALQRENALLAQRVEILEVAVERQSVVLNMMTATSASASAPAGAASAASARAAASSGPELLEWARRCTLEAYVVWYKEHLQDLSLALLALEDSSGRNPMAAATLVQLVSACWVRNTLLCIFQPLIHLRLKGFNMETGRQMEPSEQHWMDVIKFMTVSAQQIADMDNLFKSYTLLHDSFRAELQDTQQELSALVETQDSVRRDAYDKHGLMFVMQQTALLKRVRSILQKTHLLYSSSIGVAALRILKPTEFAKCCVQSYPYYPCGPSLMRACCQLQTLMTIWGSAAGGLKSCCGSSTREGVA